MFVLSFFVLPLGKVATSLARWMIPFYSLSSVVCIVTPQLERTYNNVEKKCTYISNVLAFLSKLRGLIEV